MEEEGRLMLENHRERDASKIMFPRSSSLVIQNLIQETEYQIYWVSVVPRPFRNAILREIVCEFIT